MKNSIIGISVIKIIEICNTVTFFFSPIFFFFHPFIYLNKTHECILNVKKKITVLDHLCTQY